MLKVIVFLVFVGITSLFAIPKGKYWIQDLPDIQNGSSTAHFAKATTVSVGGFMVMTLLGKKLEKVED